MIIHGSSSIREISYNATKKKLTIAFVSGAAGVHDNVDPSTWTRLSNAESKGKYYAANIKGNKKFPYTRKEQVGGLSVSVVNKPSDKKESFKKVESIEKISRQFHKLVKQDMKAHREDSELE